MSTSCGISSRFNTLSPSDPVPNDQPVLIYDGDCGFCERWARLWRAKSKGKLDVIPYQELGERLPQAGKDRCAKSVHLAEPMSSGIQVTTASKAAVRSHLIAGGKNPDKGIYAITVPCLSILLYLPYKIVARYRGFFNTLLFGNSALATEAGSEAKGACQEARPKK